MVCIIFCFSVTLCIKKNVLIEMYLVWDSKILSMMMIIYSKPFDLKASCEYYFHCLWTICYYINNDFVILLLKIREPPRVLKPKHLSDEQSRSWRPMIGMTHSNQRGSLATSGHRTLSYVWICNFYIFLKWFYNYKYFIFPFRHYVPRNPGQFSSVPPPQSNYIHWIVLN